jgi:hypothetical protein
MTPLGYIMLPVGLAGLFLSKRWLYRLFVFSTLFSATSAINLAMLTRFLPASLEGVIKLKYSLLFKEEVCLH